MGGGRWGVDSAGRTAARAVITRQTCAPATACLTSCCRRNPPQIPRLRPDGATVVNHGGSTTLGARIRRREKVREEMDTTSPSTRQSVTEPMWREVIAQLRAFVRRRIADPDRAEDLVGDIVLRIHQNLGSVDDQERLAHWVSRVARNAVIDEYRRAARAREQLLDTPADTAAVATMGPDPDDASSVLDELSRCLRPLLAGLPAEQRRAVEMIDLDGMPQAGAARRENVSLSGMKSRVQRGRRRLAELLGQCCTLTLDARGVPMDYERAPGCTGGCGCS